MVFSSIAPGVYATTQTHTPVSKTQIDGNVKLADLNEINNLETLITDNNLKMDCCYSKIRDIDNELIVTNNKISILNTKLKRIQFFSPGGLIIYPQIYKNKLNDLNNQINQLNNTRMDLINKKFVLKKQIKFTHKKNDAASKKMEYLKLKWGICDE